MTVTMTEAIHSTAVIGPEVEIAEDVRVGPFAILEGPVRVGPGCIDRGPRLPQRPHDAGAK